MLPGESVPVPDTGLPHAAHQPLCVRCHITDAKHDAGVTMPAIFIGDVDVDDIAAFQPL